MARAMWLFYLSKVIDLADTVSLTIKKKNNMIVHC